MSLLSLSLSLSLCLSSLASYTQNTKNRFGPKNAPATQTQYLYLFGQDGAVDSSQDCTALSTVTPRRGAVLLLTQFEGIPCADVFKVMHYWTFETGDATGGASRTNVRIGLSVHFIKNSMLKGQISSGVRDELVGLSQRWCLFAEARAVHAVRLGADPDSGSSSGSSSGSGTGSGSGSGATEATVGGAAQHRGSKHRLSLKDLADAGLAAENVRGAGGQETGSSPLGASPSSPSSAAGAGSGLVAQQTGVDAKGGEVASAHLTSERHLLWALAALTLLLVVQLLYSRSLVGRLNASSEALELLKAEVARQAAAHESLFALFKRHGLS